MTHGKNADHLLPTQTMRGHKPQTNEIHVTCCTLKDDKFSVSGPFSAVPLHRKYNPPRQSVDLLTSVVAMLMHL